MTIAPANGHIFQTLDETQFVQSRPEYFDQYFLGEKRTLLPGPEAFLADCIENRVIVSHFHRVDQFQVFFGSPGAYYQRTPLPKALLHYADVYSVYGPFGAGPETHLNFFTLRGSASDFRGVMPGNREDLLYNGKRHLTIDLEQFFDRGIPDKGATNFDIAIAPEPDGLAAYVARVGPHSELNPPSGELRTGRFCVVVEGELHYEDRVFGPRSLGWSSGDADEIEAIGGPEGTIVLLLHMPFPSTPIARLANT